ncbi:MAG: hypothetical protein J6S95_07020 [Lachnospiraceae bacterium]|nr:hypothetical protein [Lachnospiraceae bacterium]
MEYVVIKSFTDKDDKRKYKVGDRYPYRGFGKRERIEELSTRKNMRGEVLIRPLSNVTDDEDKIMEDEGERRRGSRKIDSGERIIND